MNKIYGRFVQNKAGRGAVGWFPSRPCCVSPVFQRAGPGTGAGAPAAHRPAWLPQRGAGPRPGREPDGAAWGPARARRTRTSTAKGRRGGAPRRGQGTRRWGGSPSQRPPPDKADPPARGRRGRPGGRAARRGRRAGGARRPRRPGRPQGGPGAVQLPRRFRLWVGRDAPRAGPQTRDPEGRAERGGRAPDLRAGRSQRAPPGKAGRGTGAGDAQRGRGPGADPWPRAPEGRPVWHPLLDIGSLLRQGSGREAVPQCQNQTLS